MNLRSKSFIIALVLCCMAVGAASAQSLDLAGSAGTTAATRWGAGFWTGGSATAMFSQHVGVNGEFVFRASDAIARRFNPYVADLNLALRPAALRWTPELLLGYGALTDETAGYGECLPLQPCGSAVHQFYSAAHLGVNVKTYMARRTFVRLEYHLYFRFGQQYPTLHPSRFAVSVGYTFGGTS